MHKETVPWVPLQKDNLQLATHENGVTSFLVDTSNYRKSKAEDQLKRVEINSRVT
jgi:hypothetical protein